jgi:hypothetical protein
MFREFFGRGSGSPGSREVLIWHCRPLLVIDQDGLIAFAGDADVEFTREVGDAVRGHAKSEVASPEGWFPEMDVLSEIVPPNDFRLGRRDGKIVFGRDAEGFEFTWYIDGQATQMLRDLDSPQEEPEVEVSPEA